MKIWYHRNPYISYFRAGQENVNCLKALGHALVDGPEEADVAILHDEPTNYAFLVGKMGTHRPKRVIGYAVWETELLSPALAPGMSLVDEAWTCSEFSRAALAPACAKVFTVPHVVRRLPLTPEEVRAARERLQAGPDDFVFLSVVDFLNPRKNVETLLAAYAAVRGQLGGRARLALKQYRISCELPDLPGLVGINEKLSDREMSALYAACDCYISPHRCEAWGLSISESMAYGRPVIATGYSGNMQYMTKDNSIPVPYSLAPISAVMRERFPIFTSDMVWAEISLPALTRAMLREASGRGNAKIRANAAKITETYGPDSVMAIIKAILQQDTTHY